MSKNGKFAAAQVLGRGIARIDLTTRKVTLVSNDTSGQMKTILAISDDGNSIADTGDSFAPYRIYTDIATCGGKNITVPIDKNKLCSYVDLAQNLQNYTQFGIAYNPEFTNNGSFVVHIQQTTDKSSKKFTFAPDPLSYRLQYLALGDSYSSGEGDVDKDSGKATHYLAGTNSSFDDCHISSRSYPFLLRDAWSIDKSRMKSVACSGAQVLRDYYRPLAGYFGQENRLHSKPDIDNQQSKALQEFTPGHVPQLEFIKKYQPKLITFTGGGNDVGFADILRYCAAPVWENLVPLLNSDCGYADEGSELEQLLYNSIDTQYSFNRKFIESVRTASPGTRITMIGYPSFVGNGGLGGCLLNSAALSHAEIAMLNRMVNYMNDMLQRLAYDTSVSFVDIESSLNGGRICEGSEYMTGVWPHISQGSELANAFHPNAKGHQRMANTIESANMYVLPQIGTYDSSKTYISSSSIQLFSNSSIIKNSSPQLTVSAGSLVAGNQYTITIHSSPTLLGIFTAASDGSLSVPINFDGIPIGKHLIIVEGLDNQNKPTKFYQFIEIHATADDADGDGIKDSDDICQFITEWYDEQTGENICIPKPVLTSTNTTLSNLATNTYQYNHKNTFVKSDVINLASNSNPAYESTAYNKKPVNNTLQSHNRSTNDNRNTKYFWQTFAWVFLFIGGAGIVSMYIAYGRQKK